MTRAAVLLLAVICLALAAEEQHGYQDIDGAPLAAYTAGKKSFFFFFLFFYPFFLFKTTRARTNPLCRLLM
jgi:hypothetical protein